MTSCPKCRKILKNASLKQHMQNIHHERVGNTACVEVPSTATFRMGPKVEGKYRCPIPGCKGNGSDRWVLYSHFAWRHLEATIIFNKDGLLLRCPQCKMFVKSPISHPAMKTCQKIQQQRRNKRLQTAQKETDTVSFTVNGLKIKRVWEFKYLGQTLT